MTVLVVSETLTQGGLETRLFTQATALAARGHRVLYATASPSVPAPLAALATETFPGIPGLGLGATAAQAADGAEQLAAIVRAHRADVVHAHPFASLVPAGMGAALAGAPLTVTAHGPSSFTGSPNFDVALFDVVLPYSASIRLVSEELRALVPTALWPRLHVVPNTVDLARFQQLSSVPRGGPWAFVGRLADGKSRALETLLRWAPHLGITAVHVVGDGPERTTIETAAASAGVTVEFLGWRDDLPRLLSGGYAGVVGMGRVVLEATALGLPCILAGYEHLHGLVTPSRFPSVAFSNFSGRGVPALDEPASLAKELADFDDQARARVRSLVAATHNEATVVTINEALLAQASPREDGRPGLLQLHALFRRTAPGGFPWAIDPSLSERLAALTRRPGQPTATATAERTAALVDVRVRVTLAEERAAWTAQLAEIRRGLEALGQQLDALVREQQRTPARLAWRLAKERTPPGVKSTLRPLSDRLRGLLKR
jgi:glycosyltransferase involved in cell wall biosynthesis